MILLYLLSYNSVSFLFSLSQPDYECYWARQDDTDLQRPAVGSVLSYKWLIERLYKNTCRGPAPADPGSSKRGRHGQGSGYNSFN